MTDLFFFLLYSNRKISDFYSEDLFINYVEVISKKASEILDLGYELFLIMKQEASAQCLQSFKQTISSGIGVSEILDQILTYNRLPRNENANFKPTKAKLLEEMVLLMRKLNEHKEGQTFAFESYDEMKVYYKEIALLKEFKFLKKGSVGPETKSMLVFDLIFPFNIKNHDDNNCYSRMDMTRFYINGGDP